MLLARHTIVALASAATELSDVSGDGDDAVNVML